MKILYTNFHGRNGGGHVTYLMHLLSGLAPEHSVTLATPASSRLYRYASELKNVHVIDMSFTTRPSSWFAARSRLRKLIKSEQFDIIHVNGSADHKQVMLALLGMGNRPRVVFTKHNHHEMKSVGHQLRAWFTTDQVIAVSDYVRGALQLTPYRRTPATTIRHGIDLDYFSPVSVQEKQTLRLRLLGAALKDKIVIGSSAGTDYEKGWLDLVEGVSLLTPEQRARFHIIVAGDVPDESKTAQVKALGMTEQVSFPGLLDDVRPYLACCDVGYVLSYFEALSYACRELMGLGLPVLITNVGGLPENVTHAEQGWVVPRKNPEAIAQILREILADPGCLQRLGAQARLRAEKEFNMSDFIASTLAVYKKVLK
ncbi:MAG: glycosyltransferase [Sheuella sp.]|nr:glycosyltransferase [Sheuella sp.]